MPSSEQDKQSGKDSRASSRGRRNESAEESVDHSVISHGMAGVDITIPARGGNEPRPSSSDRVGGQRGAKVSGNTIPVPDDEARGRSTWLLPPEDPNRTTAASSRTRSEAPYDASLLIIDAYNIYGIRASEPGRAKRLACKVANDGMGSPSLNMLRALNPSQKDLAAALEFASEVIVENCGRLQGTANGNRGAVEYIRTWQPIGDEGAERNSRAPASMLRYLLFLCLTSVEEVHVWANIGCGGPVPNEENQAEQATEWNYRKTHGLSANTSEAA